jgi:hypothetical protein
VPYWRRWRLDYFLPTPSTANFFKPTTHTQMIENYKLRLG